MDKLDVIRKTEELGGTERRSALEHLMVRAHALGCDSDIGGGKDGGINFRYGMIRYAIIDVNVHGVVKVYVQPHPGKDAPEEMIDMLNGIIDKHEGLQPRSFPISSYGHLADPLEDIPQEHLHDYLEKCVAAIRENYYGNLEMRSA